jgi:Flp pilus assembly protein TadG
MMTGVFKSVLNRIRGFRSNLQGSVAIVYGFAVVPLIVTTGFVIDYSRASALKSELTLAADTAVLSAVAVNIPEGQEQAVVEKYMRAHFSEAKGVALESVSVTSEHTALGREIKVNYTAKSRTMMSGIMGMDYMPISGVAKAVAEEPSYSDVTFVLDKSASMLLAASDADRVKMESITKAATGEECAFACHRPMKSKWEKKTINGKDEWVGTYYGPSSTEVAHQNGIQLRQDVMKTAVRKILLDLKKDQAKLTIRPDVPRYVATIVDFGTDWQVTQAKNRNLNAVSPSGYISTPDLEAAANAVSTVDGVEWEWTNYDKVWSPTNGVPALANLQTSGDGFSETSRKKHVVLVTDGVADFYGSNGSRTISSFNPELCSPVKNRGIKVIVLYTRYYRMPQNSFYMNNVDPWFSEIETKLRGCSSTGMFITADNTDEMNLAFARIFTVLNGTRTKLTQ